MKLLVVAAHPDDVALGSGGTAARLAREGASIHAVVLGRGSTSRCADPDQVAPRVVEDLRTCSEASARILGLESLTHLDIKNDAYNPTGSASARDFRFPVKSESVDFVAVKN